MNAHAETIIIDFTCKETTEEWYVIDDRIMGGSSQSRTEYLNGIGMRFTGKVSLENNGGFASIRSESADYDLSAASGVTLCIKGDGRKYKLSLRTDDYFDGISYQAEFETKNHEWEEIQLPFDSFIPTHHGQKLTTVSPFDKSRVQSFGLFIANHLDEPFQLDVAWIKALSSISD